MPQSIENPADYEISPVIRFRSAKDVKAAEINRLISEVYVENIMSERMVRKWAGRFKDGPTNVHDEEGSGRPFVITEDLVQNVEGKVRENRHFMISSLSSEFHKFQEVFFMEMSKDISIIVSCANYGQEADTYEDEIKKLCVGYDKCLKVTWDL
ncbi:hypothetical protein AVEN_272380-1 [Araneus ventricosus]|uniref:Mos1 transposase HTH domain-containing protein n=1 Tax=Araneus ventricosus TaxID=182803 RepID=A0A4Y2HZP2_ARAVE|nr:hypothetical protein AVEN_272380-1 [Araneus ventricosus]